MLNDAFNSIYRLAFKADVPPDWFTDSRRLSALIQGEWNRLTGEFLTDVQQAIRMKDYDKATELISDLKRFDFELSPSGNAQLALMLDGIQNRAIAAYTLHGLSDGLVSRIKEFDGDYRKFLTQAHAEQIKSFVAKNPGRILHPEIERQVAYVRDTAEGRFVDVSLIAERMERVVKQEEYWKGLSDVQVSRLWHHDGVKLAEENKIDVLYVSGPDDIRTCPVCKTMLGQRLEVKRVLKRFEDHAKITDPDEYVKAWPFPRFEQIDNMSNEERVEKTGHMPPPYHPHCRHGVSWLTGVAETKEVVKEPKRAEPKVDIVHSEIKRREDWLKSSFSKDEIKKLGSIIDNTIKEGTPSIRVWSSVVDQVIADGRFKSQFETKRSGGLYDKKVRSRAEELLFGTKPKPKDRWIYGYLSPGDTDTERAVRQYGDVIAKIKKPVFLERGTVTLNDSLVKAGEESMAWQPVSAQKPSPALAVEDIAGKNYRGDKARTILTEGKIQTHRPYDGAWHGSTSYVEIQFAQGLSADEISELVFTRGAKPSEAVKKWANLHGVKITITDGWGSVSD